MYWRHKFESSIGRIRILYWPWPLNLVAENATETETACGHRNRPGEIDREKQKERQKDRKTERQTDTQTDTQTDRKRQTETERHISPEIH